MLLDTAQVCAVLKINNSVPSTGRWHSWCLENCCRSHRSGPSWNGSNTSQGKNFLLTNHKKSKLNRKRNDKVMLRSAYGLRPASSVQTPPPHPPDQPMLCACGEDVTHPQSPRRMARPRCPMSCILKRDAFKWANSYTDNFPTGPVGLMESLAHGKGCFSSCGSVTGRCQVTTKGMWEKRLGNKSQCVLVRYKPWATPTTLPDCWGLHPEWQEHNWDHSLSLNGRNKMAASLTRKGDRNYIDTY